MIRHVVHLLACDEIVCFARACAGDGVKAPALAAQGAQVSRRGILPLDAARGKTGSMHVCVLTRVQVVRVVPGTGSLMDCVESSMVMNDYCAPAVPGASTGV